LSLVVRGLDLSKVKAAQQDMSKLKAGRTLILDGDGPAYRAAATSKRLDTAVRRFQSAVLTELMMTGCSSATVHLTHRTSHKNGRHHVIATKPYQGQRKGKDKPPLLELLRDSMVNREHWLPEFTVDMHYTIEADDAMIIQAHQLKMDGVVWSDDKDLRCTPYLFYEQAEGRVGSPEPHGYVEEKFTPGGTLKCLGRGPIFFWAQLLMGDSADNIAGVQRLGGKLCGPAGALGVLKAIKHRDEAANIVTDAYRAIDQNIIAEGFLLHLLQHPRDHVYEYLQSFDLSPANRQFVQDCHVREWFKAPDQVVR
jgi:hypothetical protein